MGTALAYTQQQLIEATARIRAGIHSENRCLRCSGLMVAEWCEDLSDYRAQRCLQCGEVIDPVILRNRGAQQRNGDRFLFPVEVDAANICSVSRWGR
jgi:DNA-directed RNA polymerase subunit RPC12/RpoP